jgi:hypothetical protein
MVKICTHKGETMSIYILTEKNQWSSSQKFGCSTENGGGGVGKGGVGRKGGGGG